jgi:DNA-binding CsgD family transcriptional regulator
MPEWVSEAEEGEQEGPGEHPDLTRREREALRLVGLGNGDDEIARKMGVTYGVAKNYLSSLRRKLGVNRTGVLPILAIKAGLVRFDELVNPRVDLKGLEGT